MNTSRSDYLYVGGLFGVHEAGQSVYTCGRVRERGLQNLEAFLWAVRSFRSRASTILRDVRVGALALDSCLSTDKSIQSVLNLESCAAGYGSPAVEPNRVLAFVGPDRSSDALSLAPLMGELRKPLVSHAATSPALSDTQYKYFLRTVPSDAEQVQAMLAVLDQLGWNHTQLVYTEDAYGRAGRDALLMAVQKAGKCVVAAYGIAATNPTEEEVDELISSLRENSRTRAVVLFVYEDVVRSVLLGAERAKARGVFTWIGTTAWADSPGVVGGLEPYAEGAVTLRPDATTPGFVSFRQYFENLRPEDNTENPWFRQYWQERFNCYLPGEPPGDFSRQCDVSKQSLEGSTLDPYVPYTIRAVDAVLNGIEGARRTACGLASLCAGFINNQSVYTSQSPVGTWHPQKQFTATNVAWPMG